MIGATHGTSRSSLGSFRGNFSRISTLSGERRWKIDDTRAWMTERIQKSGSMLTRMQACVVHLIVMVVIKPHVVAHLKGPLVII